MNRQSKTVQVDLLDNKSREVLASGFASITLVVPTSPSARPSYETSFELAGYAPLLSGRTCVLKIGEIIEGEVLLNIVGDPSTERTLYEMHLQDPIWNNIEWFHHIEVPDAD